MFRRLLLAALSLGLIAVAAVSIVTLCNDLHLMAEVHWIVKHGSFLLLLGALIAGLLGFRIAIEGSIRARDNQNSAA
jgi:hypothetical protein